MSCKIPDAVEEYLRLVESDTPRACPEQHALAAHIRHVFETEDLVVVEARLAKYLSLDKYFPFELHPWERFLTALWFCTYRAPGVPRWPKLFCMVGRGAGKDGYIGFSGFAAVSPYNPVPKYDVDICANDEEQAMRPLKDVIDVLETPKLSAKLKRFFYHTKELIRGIKNRGTMRGRTNNPKNREGMRSGVVIFNEVHSYENYDNIKVYRTGLGKVEEPREGAFSSNGHVMDGPLDDYLERSNQILFQGEDDGGFLPFVCRLSSEEQVHDPDNWSMANPSLQYRPALRREIEDEYREWLQHPEQHGDFLTKRMGLRKGFQELAVTEYAKIKATNQPLPDLTGWTCTVGLDYAELSDWAAVDFHFRRGNDRFDINHAWVCMQSKTLHRIKAPFRDWAKTGDLTLVDDVSISADLLAAYIADLGKLYNIKMLALDNFRWTLVSDSLRKIGFDAADKTRVKLVRPSDIMQVEPVIQECFDRGYFHWGDVPHLRWAVNNTKRLRSSRKQGSDTGNYYYAKIEGKSRKTDPFMALVASMTVEPVLGTGEPVSLPPIGAITL